MEYTEQQRQGFKATFAERRRRRFLIMTALVVVTFASVILLQLNPGTVPPTVVLPIWIALVIGANLYVYRTARCPACDKFIGGKRNPKFCPNCGVALSD